MLPKWYIAHKYGKRIHLIINSRYGENLNLVKFIWGFPILKGFPRKLNIHEMSSMLIETSKWYEIVKQLRRFLGDEGMRALLETPSIVKVNNE